VLPTGAVRQRTVGLRHAGRIVTIEIAETVLRVYDERGDYLANHTPPAPNPWPDSRPTVFIATAQPASALTMNVHRVGDTPSGVLGCERC
jgi:hypothetical protein